MLRLDADAKPVSVFESKTFVPHTLLEKDIVDSYNHFKYAALQAGLSGVFVIVDHNYDRHHSFAGILFNEPKQSGADHLKFISEAISEIEGKPHSDNAVIFALDLDKPFEVQWPYKAPVASPAALSVQHVFPDLQRIKYSGRAALAHKFDILYFYPGMQKVGQGLPSRPEPQDKKAQAIPTSRP